MFSFSCQAKLTGSWLQLHIYPWHESEVDLLISPNSQQSSKKKKSNKLRSILYVWTLSTVMWRYIDLCFLPFVANKCPRYSTWQQSMPQNISVFLLDRNNLSIASQQEKDHFFFTTLTSPTFVDFFYYLDIWQPLISPINTVATCVISHGQKKILHVFYSILALTSCWSNSLQWKKAATVITNLGNSCCHGSHWFVCEQGGEKWGSKKSSESHFLFSSFYEESSIRLAGIIMALKLNVGYYAIW